ncbi:MAG: tRNA preQ1(34) S-adenosylmethionine ribosyltransferase-isomerase QueA [Phycisphaerae bacterium]
MDNQARLDDVSLVGSYDYALDESLIAQRPLEGRDQSRLMVLRRGTGTVEHHIFRELPSLLRGGDLLVLNDTRVIPARFFCRRRSGGRIEGLFLRQEFAGRWEVMLKGAGRCAVGEVLSMDGAPEITVTLASGEGGGLWLVDIAPPEDAQDVLARAGVTPLPPYIRRRVGRDLAADGADRERYQTVYADRGGAVAAPTAGLHFTQELLAALEAAGIGTARVTLHVGMGTFLPIKSASVTGHRMHREWYDLPSATADALNAARREGRRIVAVGTTTIRVLETAAAAEGFAGQFTPVTGWTDMFIRPPYEFRAADALITNFHLPRSTLLMLVAAFASPGRTDGLKVILAAYEEARRLRYRFYSYGDAMLIE